MGIKSFDEIGKVSSLGMSPDAVRAIVRNSDVRDVAKAATHVSKTTKTFGILGEFFRGQILFNFKTQVTNTLSGFTETFLKPSERMLGSLFLTKSEGL